MEQKHNKQLHTGEYSTERSTHEQQLIYKVIFGIFPEYSWNILHVRPCPEGNNTSANSTDYFANFAASLKKILWCRKCK